MEANGFDLEDYFKKLTLEKNDLQNKTILKENSIDLFSCHKAKGLEWDTVILPFLNKKIFPPSFNYPVIVSEKGDVAIDKSSREPFKESLDKKRNNEIERLLYVALTRGKNNLILINDKDLFNCKHSSFFNVLNSVNNGFINLLPENLEEDKKFKLNEIINNKEILEYKFPNKIKNSIIHPVKILPSKIKSEKIEILKELEEKPIDYKNFKDDGAIYGDWFHNLLENLPWKKPLNTWQTHFNNYIKLSPDKNRSTIEWEIFINSKFILKLINESFDFYPELPVFYPLENGDIMEGFIDLAIKTKNEWIIIDWKTDRYVLKDPSTLIKKYKFQINAYKKALNSITKITCRGFLYSSVMGKSFEI